MDKKKAQSIKFTTTKRANYTRESVEYNHTNRGVSYRTKPAANNRLDVGIRIYAQDMKKMGWVAGDRIAILHTNDDDAVLGLTKDPHGYKLCPAPIIDETYEDAMGKARNCSFHLRTDEPRFLQVSATSYDYAPAAFPDDDVLVFEIDKTLIINS